MELRLFAKLVNEKCGIFIGDGQNDTLVKAIKSRMSHSGINTQNKYYESLLSDNEETHRLIDLLTVNETHFFREKTHYDLLSKHLIPELMARKKATGKKIRLLSAGCSSGEEPYTLAMVLCEQYGFEILNSVSIIGCDINQEVLEKARRGIYGNHSFRGCQDFIRNQYFKSVQSDWPKYEIRDEIKKAVDFQKVNLLSDTYPEQIQDIDIIFYRNVSIYFKREVQIKIFNKLSGVLNDEGYIFTSSTETYLHNVGILFLTEIDGGFVYRKKIEIGVDDRRKYKTILLNPIKSSLDKPVSINSKAKQKTTRTSSLPPKVPALAQASAKQDCRVKTISQELFDKALYEAIAKNHASALSYAETLINNFPTLVKAYNLKASILTNLNRLAEARDACAQTLKLDEWNLECLLLLGLIAKIEKKYDESLKYFKTAIYIQPDCWLAHFYLGEIQNFNGISKEACREYGIAMKLIEKKGLEDHGITYFPIAYSVEHLIHLCRVNISAMNSDAV